MTDLKTITLAVEATITLYGYDDQDMARSQENIAQSMQDEQFNLHGETTARINIDNVEEM